MNHLDIAPQYASILMGMSNTFATIPGIVSPSLTGAIVHDKVSSQGGGGGGVGGFSVNHLDIAPQYASILMGLSNTFATIPGIVSHSLTSAIVHDKVSSWGAWEGGGGGAVCVYIKLPSNQDKLFTYTCSFSLSM